MYVPRGIHPRVLNSITWRLRKHGLWVERHTYSYRIMYRGKLIASLHIYPGYDEAILRLYSGDETVDQYIVDTVSNVFKELLPGIKLKIEVLSSPSIL